MSSELQLDVRHLNRWRRHLVNAYEVRQAWCLLQVKLCDPWLSALKWSLPCKALYKCSALPLPLRYTGPISLCIDLFVFICVYFVCFCFKLHSCCIIVNTVGWTWWDWSLILRTLSSFSALTRYTYTLTYLEQNDTKIIKILTQEKWIVCKRLEREGYKPGRWLSFLRVQRLEVEDFYPECV